jgi:hypothetical protein
MIKKLLLIVVSIFGLQSCNVGGSRVWKNENIDKEKREQIKALNDKLFKSIINNDVVGTKALMSDKLEKGSNDLDKLIKQVSSSFKADGYRILDEYNVKNSTTGIGNTLPSGVTGDNDYVISYQALNKEMYVSLMIPEDLDNELLITAIYGRYDNDWKINILQFGQYTLLNKTAPDYYKLAKASYDKSYLIDAVNFISLSKQCLSPANNFFRYQKDKEINEFHEMIMKEVNSKYQLPLTLDNVGTKPKVFRIYPEMLKDGVFPMIYYLSEINLMDTTALKIENKKVREEVGRLFTGIDQNKKFVFYWAFNKIPDGKTPVEHYGFIDKRTE